MRNKIRGWRVVGCCFVAFFTGMVLLAWHQHDRLGVGFFAAWLFIVCGLTSSEGSA